MRPKKDLPRGAEEVAREGEYILVMYMLNGEPYYGVYSFYESENGKRYFPRGGGGRSLEQATQQLERITGVKRH
jgi:predicted ATPase